MHIKTVNVTNRSNVVIQIPGCVISTWKDALDKGLELHYDKEQDCVIIRPALQGGSGFLENSQRMARGSA